MSFVVGSSADEGSPGVGGDPVEHLGAVAAISLARLHALVPRGTGLAVGAHDEGDAEKCAKASANSLLCKTAWFGGDPNWGRILDAAGYSGARINTSQFSLYYEGTAVVKAGIDAGVSEEKMCEILDKDEFRIELDLGVGNAEYTAWTCDISYEYVKINAEYRT